MKKIGVKIIGIHILVIGCLWATTSFGQTYRGGNIIQPATTIVMDPIHDNYITLSTNGFSIDNNNITNPYCIDQFEFPMYGIPEIGSGDVLDDNIGNACGITDLIPDTKGYSV